MDWVTIVAIILGPILAVQASNFTEQRKRERGRKDQILRTLIATSTSDRLSKRHVEALNMINLEYRGCTDRKGKEVREAWKQYYDILYNYKSTPSEQLWIDKADDLFYLLLFKMSKYLGYHYDDITTFKRSFYSPQAHDDSLQRQKTVDEFIRDVASGKKAVPIEMWNISQKPDSPNQ